jgi:hypothetical protein
VRKGRKQRAKVDKVTSEMEMKRFSLLAGQSPGAKFVED